MPSVFDEVIAGFDLTITTPGDWTVHAADLPNGDPAVSLSTALNQNAYHTTESGFTLTNGSGTEAKTVEFWIKVTAGAAVRGVCISRVDSTSTSGGTWHWEIQLTAAESVTFFWYNTAGGNYVTVGSPALSAGWHHAAVIIRHGSSRVCDVYIDGVFIAASASTSGTATYDTSNTWAFFVGSRRVNSDADMTDHLAKLAIYPRALTSTEIETHYLTMVAT